MPSLAPLSTLLSRVAGLLLMAQGNYAIQEDAVQNFVNAIDCDIDKVNVPARLGKVVRRCRDRTPSL
jgi:hypothetical protein